MKLDDRALLQERVRTLVLRHALEAALERLAGATGCDAGGELATLERTLLVTARGLADRAATQKLAVLAAVEDAGATIRAAFAGTHARLDRSQHRGIAQEAVAEEAIAQEAGTRDGAAQPVPEAALAA